MPQPTQLEDVPLSPRLQEVLGLVDDAALRDDVTRLARHALAALNDLGRIHLPQDHFEEGESARPAGDKRLELAPYVLAALSRINSLLGFVAETFPAPAQQVEEQSDDDFDLEFDLVDGPTGDGVGLSHRQQTGATLTPREQVADALYAFAGMLRSRQLDFARRLEFSLGQDDTWPLLAELDDTQHRLTKAVQGVLFGVLAVFASEMRREEILPAYRSAVSESVALRAAVADLTFHISRLNAALAEATPEQAVPLVVAVADRLARFSSRPEYRTLRAEDKRAVIDFRRSLHDLRGRPKGIPMGPLRTAVEGFSKFLEAMSAINHREVLVVHDRQRLEQVAARLQELAVTHGDAPDGGQAALASVVEDLGAVTGRNPELDQALRDFAASPPAADDVPAELLRWQALVQGTMAVVG